MDGMIEVRKKRRGKKGRGVRTQVVTGTYSKGRQSFFSSGFSVEKKQKLDLLLLLLVSLAKKG